MYFLVLITSCDAREIDTVYLSKFCGRASCTQLVRWISEPKTYMMS